MMPLGEMSAFTDAGWLQNPSTTQLGDGCNMIQGLYYCIQVNYIALTTSKTATATSTSTSKSSSSTTTPVVTTPTPTQTGIASNCDDFYFVVSGDTCYDIAAAQGISLDDFYAWNPAVGTSCGGLQAGYYVCVGVSSGTTTTTKSTLSTSTVSQTTTTAAAPSPTQSGLTSNCDDFYLVVSGDGCYDIAADNGISLDDFYDWNPAVGDDCSGLWPNYYVCVGISTTAPTTTTTSKATTTTSSGNGITTPTPTQAGMVSNCDTFHLVVSGDGCYDLAASAGITLDEFYSWNPAVGDDCSGLWTGYYVCIGIQ